MDDPWGLGTRRWGINYLSVAFLCSPTYNGDGQGRAPFCIILLVREQVTSRVLQSELAEHGMPSTRPGKLIGKGQCMSLEKVMFNWFNLEHSAYGSLTFLWKGSIKTSWSMITRLGVSGGNRPKAPKHWNHSKTVAFLLPIDTVHQVYVIVLYLYTYAIKLFLYFKINVHVFEKQKVFMTPILMYLLQTDFL